MPHPPSSHRSQQVPHWLEEAEEKPQLEEFHSLSFMGFPLFQTPWELLATMQLGGSPSSLPCQQLLWQLEENRGEAVSGGIPTSSPPLPSYPLTLAPLFLADTMEAAGPNGSS